MSDRKRALICFPHGIGDVIMATPSIRALHDAGYLVDMMVRPSVIDSHALDACPYIGTLIKARTDTTEDGFNKYHMPRFRELLNAYDWNGVSRLQNNCVHRTELIASELKVKPSNYHFEVWIPQECETEAAHFINNHAPDGKFVYVHTKTEVHRQYWWESTGYVERTFPGLPIFDSGEGGNIHKAFDNINTNFALLKYATHRVLSLSIMAAAADALQLQIDVLNAAIPKHTCLPMNRKLVKQYRIDGKIR